MIITRRNRPVAQHLIALLLGGILLTGLLTGCEEDTVPPAPSVRALKTIVLAVRAGEQTRTIAGITEASTVTDLAFETAGRITDIPVDIGDHLNKATWLPIGSGKDKSGLGDRRLPRPTVITRLDRVNQYPQELVT